MWTIIPVCARDGMTWELVTGLGPVEANRPRVRGVHINIVFLELMQYVGICSATKFWCCPDRTISRVAAILSSASVP